MNKEEIIIPKNREDDSLTNFTQSIYDQISEYQKTHSECGFFVVAGDKKGGVAFASGKKVPVVRAFFESVLRNEECAKILNNVIFALNTYFSKK